MIAVPEIGSASLAVIPSFTGFQSKLENGTSKHMAAAGASGGSKFGDEAAKSGGARFKAGMAKAAKVAAAGLAIGVAGAIKFAGDSIAEAREAQKVGALTESTIKATGGAAKVTAQQVGDLAGAISRKSGVDDEAIQSGANLILTFKNIRNAAGKGNKIFDRSTQAVTDMAAAMAGGSGGELDLKAASIQVGKALNDPVKGVAALSKVGVQFSTQQRAQIKALVEGGDANAAMALGLIDTTTTYSNLLKANGMDAKKVADILTNDLTPAQKKAFDMYAEGGHTLEAQKRILKELNSEFGGAAAAQATQADKLKVAWGNFKEEIGTELLPTMDKLSKFLRKKGIPALRDASDWVKNEGIPQFKEFAGHVKDVAGFLNDLPRSIKIGGLGALAALTVGAKLRSGGSGPLGAAGRAAGLVAPVKTFETNPAALGAGAAGGAGKATGKLATVLSKGVLPVAVVAWSGLALKDFFDWNHKGDKSPVEHAISGGKMGDIARNLFDPQADDIARDKAAKLDNIRNAAEKVERQLGDTKNAGQVLADVLFKIDRSDPKVQYTAPGFDELLRKTREYDSLLDGLNNRLVTTIMQTRYVKNDPGEGGGTNPQPPNRSGSGGVTVNIGEVRPNNYSDFMTEMDRRTRGSSLDGVRQ